MTDQSNEQNFELAQMTVEIITAYVANNAVQASDLPKLIADVHASISGLDQQTEETAVEPQKPAVPIRRSLSPDQIICLDCGLQYKSIKRHLQVSHGMTPDEYRAKWGLPADYPMVAPNYSAQRSKLAKKSGLGRK